MVHVQLEVSDCNRDLLELLARPSAWQFLGLHYEKPCAKLLYDKIGSCPIPLHVHDTKMESTMSHEKPRIQS